MRGYLKRLESYWKSNQLVIIASAVFLIVQWLYSWLMWHRTGNLPPTPGDSYNYLVNVHQIADGKTFLTSPGQLVYASFNYLYGLTAQLFHANPQTIYHLYFYLGKLALLAIIVYLLGGLTKNKKLIALLILALAVYAGTGETHGFFWVVPSFWSVAVFLLLLGMAFRQVNFWPMLLIAIFFMFIHPLSVYTSVPVILSAFTLRLIKSPVSPQIARLAWVLVLAAVFQQVYLVGLNKLSINSNSAAQLSSVSSAVENGVVMGVDPHGNEGLAQRSGGGSVQIGLLSIHDVIDKLKSPVPKSSFHFQITVPANIYRIVPGFYELWNAYAFFFAPLPYLLILIPAVLFLMGRWGLEEKDTATVIFLSSLATAIAATVHPQGFRFLVFAWPLTIIALVNYLWSLGQLKRQWRNVIAAVIALFLLGQLSYGIFLTRRIAIYQDYQWDKSCAAYLVQKRVLNSQMVLFYSGNTLAPTAFIGEGLYNTTAVDSGVWTEWLANPDNGKKTIIYLNDRFDGFSTSGTVSALAAKMDEAAKTRGKAIKWTSCGRFQYGEEI